VTFVQANLEAPDALPDGGYDVLCGVSVLHHLDLDKTLPALRTKLKPTGVFAFSEPNLANPINKYLLFTDNLEKRKKHGLSPGEQAFYAGELFEIFRKAGFHVRSLRHRDFMHPSVPRFLIPAWSVVQSLAERLPLVRTWSGSLWIHGTRGSS
jgi:SAM-dependent methyltransferase